MPRAETRDLFTPAPLPQAPLDDAQRLACLRLIRSEQIGPVTFRELINHCGGADAALAALPDLARRGGRRRPIRLCAREVAEAELETAAKLGSTPLFTIEPGYPAHLALTDVPPPLLYVKGQVGLLARPMLAVVGSRNASAAGRKLAQQIAASVGSAGLVVASGLARGIDASAHEATLSTGTVAVLAGGIDFVYPPEHAMLQDRIAAEGCLVTEQPPGFAPRGQDFPRRNRIIAGISLAVLVVEAARRSGSLITARLAGEQGREVMAVPGHPLDPRAEGTNQLLKDGATLVTGADDVLGVLRPILERRVLDVTQTPSPRDATPSADRSDIGFPDEQTCARVFEALGPAPVDIDTLARTTGLDIRGVRIALLELALADRIEQHGAQLVSRKSI